MREQLLTVIARKSEGNEGDECERTETRHGRAQFAGAIFRIDPVGVSFVLPGPSWVSRSMAM